MASKASKSAPRGNINRGVASTVTEAVREVATPTPKRPRTLPPAPAIAGLDLVTKEAMRYLYATAIRAGVTADEIAGFSTLRLRPRVGQYKAELLAWLGSAA